MDNHIKGLFPITQAADACGLSRSTLMRMEERGLLTPAALPRGIDIVAPYTGREIDLGKYCSRIVMPVAE